MKKLASLCWTRFRASKDQSPTLSIPQKKNGSVSVSLVTLLPSCAPLCTKKNGGGSLQSFLQGQAGDIHTSLLAFGIDDRVLHFCRTSPCCPSHMHQVPIVPFHRVEAQTVHLPDPQWLSSQHTWHYDTLGLFGHSSQLITDIRDSSPCEALTEEHVQSSCASSVDSVLQCCITPSDQC